MTRGRVRDPFSHPDWLFEIKWDGFRCLLEYDGDGVCLISRNENEFPSFPVLVAKHKDSLYAPEQRTTWLKIRNRGYSLWVGREELFERKRHQEPVLADWEGCARAAFVSS